MVKPTEVKLREFLKNSNLAVPKSPPWIHSTASSNLIPILNEEKLLAVKCNVFQGEKLCYLFVGRAAYKGKDALNPEPWQLPTVFVMRFSNPPPLKRIHPFDTGAFERGRMPDYLTTFKLEDFNVGTDQDQIGRLISLYFETPRRYVDRDANDQKKLKEEHLLNMSHSRVLAVSKLYKEGSTKDCDDRAAVIELQVEADIPLKKENLLGVVVPEEFQRTPGVTEALKELTNVIETYRLLPLNVSQHCGLIYECVEQVYKRAGINL
ncbi:MULTISPECIES: hypothetical protein [unclassified Bradyrhizobium]|uniref:hypothetical protein n=1 Tax=unclassified Bradyrhizobium TaxID=2631580 RepID=UPI001FFB14DD|nr:MULTISPECIES: hypothetical protein [unclassified Bradyrhizobium]MCK1418127.1 hypothetical protein [Bradyrhizobium sp. CW4]MCK1426326.1 hypothetical protein [Bradyrhizobium sp. 87]MCK1538254.1 hypothetical protein [Bradyrhizobium sp. 176]MCK1560309.1 hypothetical protein [Bradyrhizobium sp. 171]MCK1571746.1 hypothetical protein [Bradyrhizobium sp. 174]